jgi:hypothetical protein
MDVLCATCKDIYVILNKKIPKNIIDLIYQYSLKWHRYCEKHQQCKVCNTLVSYNSARHINNYLNGVNKDILCIKHRKYADHRLKYTKSKYMCWSYGCDREGVEELTCLSNRAYSCKGHINEWYNGEEICEDVIRFNKFKSTLDA